MPYVSVDEAQNLPVLDTGELLRDLVDAQRSLLVASDALRVVFLRVGAGEEPHPPHRHPEADEAMLVMDGHGTFSVGSGPGIVAGPGSLIYVPRGVIHRIQVTGPEPLAWLSIVAPNLDGPDEAVEGEG